MKIYNDYKNLPAAAQGAVVCLGNFDGIHRGHQALLSAARAAADDRGAKTGVVSFEPHPRRLFRPDDPPFRITPAAVKSRLLAGRGVDFLYDLPFDWDFASQSAEQFARGVLIDGIKPAHVIVGYDFCFGQLRKGTPQTLIDAGLNVTVVDKITDGGVDALSSSAIRQALRIGDIAKANNALGWAWEIEGVVVRGDQRGRALGYPTANTPLGETLHPAYGIYASLLQIADDGPDSPWYPAATNIGIRPMFEVAEGQVESFIFDFDRDIYDRTIRVRPIQRLRGEARFDSLEALKSQMAEDCRQVRGLFS